MTMKNLIKILSFCQIIIYLRLITTQVNPLILSSNAKCQWVNCSRIESHKSSWEQQMIKTARYTWLLPQS